MDPLDKVIPKEILIGKIGAPHGVKGQVRVFSYTDPIENIVDYQPWRFKRQGQEIALQVVKKTVVDKMLLVQFADIVDRDQASQLTHTEIYVDRAKLPVLNEGEYYWSDLQGLTVINLDGFKFGRVTHLLSTGANDVMFVEGEKSYCLPYLPDSVIKKIDLAKQEIIVDWPAEI